MKIAVAVVVYNGEKWLKRCLTSIAKDPLADLFIWNNNSTDGSRDIIDGFKEVSFVVHSSSNIGFGKANNRLVEKVIQSNQYEYCLLLNQDAFLLSNTLTTFKERLNAFQKYTVICPLHLSPDQKHIDDDLSRYINNENLHAIIDHFPNKLNKLENIYPMKFTLAAAWFLKLADIKKLGLFDPIFFYTAEDNDFAHRLTYHQFKMGITPHIAIVHDKYKRPRLLPSNIPKYRHSHHSDVYLRLKDIRYPYFKGWLAALVYLIVHLIQSILNFQGWRLKMNLKLLIQVIFQHSTVLNHRKKSKELNGPFLNLNE